MLADILRESGKEKVTRIIIAALRVSLVKMVFEHGSFHCWILRKRRRFFLVLGEREVSARKLREKREENVRGECASGGPDSPFVYSPRAPHTRPHSPKSREETASVQHLILKWKILQFKMK